MDLIEIDYSKESILIVDDDEYLRNALEELLISLKFQASSAGSGPEALTILKEDEFTFLLTDMRMPEMDGLELIKKVRAEYHEISIIAMTAYSEGYRYIDVINSGASDFINKPFELGELEAKIKRIITERNLRKELSRLSITDSLTGLFNQRHFYKRLSDEFLRSSRQKVKFALILLDLDNFKSYNDTHGHLAGDEILKSVGLIINQSIRVGVDSGYRYGGDEFAIILIDANLNIAHGIGKRIQESLSKNQNIRISIGYAEFNDHITMEEIISEADEQLYKSKGESKINHHS
ncbi:MAG: diguanylate cyclase [Desulfobacteraceae bacterium]|nr:MAG: diguanylate cyclase [Desulfobacteraceae bacterium]